MATYYVDGTNGNDTYDGTSPTFVSGTTGPKKTLTSMEAKPVAAGDLVHVRPGVYRETLTCGVSGTNGNPIEYRGDYTGAIWAGGGVVCITGSNDDKTSVRNNAVTGTKDYRKFVNLAFVLTSQQGIAITTTGTVVDRCYFDKANGVQFAGTGTANSVTNSMIVARDGAIGVEFVHTATVDNAGHVVNNCLFWGARFNAVASNRVGGIVIGNSTFVGPAYGVRVLTIPAAGQTITVNNCVFTGCSLYGVGSASAGYIVEDYNIFFSNQVDRQNVSPGANSVSFAPLFDARWFFQLVTATAANQVVTPFDLSSWSQLINLAGASPTATDMRGTSAIGGTREIGALEYDSSLKIQGGSGGAVSIGPSRRGLGG